MFREESDFSHRRLSPARGENVISLHLQECECTRVLVAPQREELYAGIQTSRSLSDSKGRFVSRTRASTETKRGSGRKHGFRNCNKSSYRAAERVRRAWVTDRV